MNKKFISSALAALMIAGSTSFSAFAAMKIGTVVIGNKAFDLAYANDPVNLTEITDAIVEGGAVYVKDFEGKWIENISSKQVSANIIPAVIYKNAFGVTNFDAADKDQVTKLAVESINAISALTVTNGTTVDKLGLPTTVAVTLSDKTTDKANITWNTALFDGRKAGDVTIKGTLSVPLGKTWILTEVQKVVSIKITVNESLVNTGVGNGSGGGIVDTTEADLNSATTLATKNYTITSNSATYGPTVGTTTVNGNVAVTNPTGSSLTLKNLNITGTLSINYGAGNVVLENVTVNGVNVSNVGSNSLHIKGNTIITTLTVDDANNDAHIVVEGNASVTTAVVKSGANIEVDQHATNAKPFVNINLAPEVSSSVIKLKGTFETVLVTKNAIVVMDAASAITNQIKVTAPLDFTVPKDVIVAKVNILPSSPTDLFKLSGDFDDVNVSAIANVQIRTGIVKISSDTNAAVNIVADSGSTVSVPAGSAIDSEKTFTGEISTIANVAKAISKDSNNPTIIGPSVGNSIINGNITIIAGDSYFMTLKNTTINGNLIINGVEGRGGSVTLQNVQVKGPNGNDGTVTVNNVGNNSLHLDGLTASTVDISDNDGARIVAEDRSTNNINTIKLSSDSVTVDPTKFEGQFDGTTLNIEKAAKVQVDGYVNNITVSNNSDTNSEIKIAQEGNIGTLDVSNSSKVNISGDSCDAASSIGNVTGTVIANDSLQNIKSDSEIYKVAVDDVVSVINKIRSEATELNSLFYRRGRDIQNIIEDKQYGFKLGSIYDSYSESLKIRVANTIRTYMQDNRSFKTKKEIQNAIDSAISINTLFAETDKFQGCSDSVYIAPSIKVGDNITNIVTNHSELSEKTNFNIVCISDTVSQEYLEYIDGVIRLKKQNTKDSIIYASVDMLIEYNGNKSYTNLNIKILPQNSVASVENGFTDKIVKVNVGDNADMTFNVQYPDYSAQPDTATEQVGLNFTFVKSVNTISNYNIVDKNVLSGLSVNYNGVDLGDINLLKVGSAQENRIEVNGIPVETYRFYVPLSSFINYTGDTKLNLLTGVDGKIQIKYSNVPSSLQGLPMSLGISSGTINGGNYSPIYSNELYILVDTGDGEVGTTLRHYNAALAAVKQENYTKASWIIYQGVVEANLVTVTNTQAEVDAATLEITTAQSRLSVAPIVTSVVTTVLVEPEGILENTTGNSAVVIVKDQYGNTMTSGYTLSYAIDENSVVSVGTDGILTAGAYSVTNHTATLRVTVTPTSGSAITVTSDVIVIARVEEILDVVDLVGLNAALANIDIKTININNDIIIPKGTNVNVRAGQTLILNSKLTVEGGIEVNGSIVTPSTPTPIARMARMAVTVNNPKLEVMGNGRIDVKAGSALRFNSFADIITPTQDSVLLYGGSKVEIGDKQYIGNKNSDALIELSNFTGSNRPVAGYFLNGDGMLLLVIFEKAEVLQVGNEVLDINILVKAGGENRLAGELKIPSLNIIKEAVGGIVIEANGTLIVGDKTIVSANDIESVFNTTGGDMDNRRGIRFFKSQYNSPLMASIRGDVIMSKPFNEAIIFPEYRPYNEFYGTDLNPTLDIKFDPKVEDFIGSYWENGTTPLMDKYKLVNGIWASVTAKLIAAITEAGTKVESNYTSESWVAADLVNVIIAADLVAKNVNATQIEIDEALKTITDAVAKLVTDNSNFTSK
jgi:hypothetical protein